MSGTIALGFLSVFGLMLFIILMAVPMEAPVGKAVEGSEHRIQAQSFESFELEIEDTQDINGTELS